MATHYEVLGVGPDSTHDEIKRAFARRALQHHPDRQGDADEAARQSAEQRMRELNAAWEVLGDPVTRAVYDRDLRGGPATSAGHAGGSAPSPSPADPVGRAAAFEPEEPTGSVVQVLDADDRRGFWAGIGMIVVILVLAVVALVFTAYANDRRGEDLARTGLAGSGMAHEVDDVHEAHDPHDGESTVALEVGSCVVFASIQGRITPMLANCSMRGAYQVTQIVPLGSPCRADQVVFDLEADMQRLCLISRVPA